MMDSLTVEQTREIDSLIRSLIMEAPIRIESDVIRYDIRKDAGLH